nr:DUF4099 domain-containing protein [Pedobacter panaciterrae]
MNPIIYKEKDLPWAELEQLGLAEKGKLLLPDGDKQALLSGRRTSMQQLRNVSDQQLHIDAIDVKVSLYTNDEGKLMLKAHPIHRYPERPVQLDELEAVQLISGATDLIHKKISGNAGEASELIFEYDAETREFISTDPLQITVPDQVNGQALTPEQRERYRQAKEVEMPDGTTLRYTGIDESPLRSNRLMIIASILLDGGLTYLAYQGLKAMRGNRNHHPEASQLSSEYQHTKSRMEKQAEQSGGYSKADADHHRSYTRSGHSR